MNENLSLEQLKSLQAEFDITRNPSDETLRAFLEGRLGKLADDLIRDRLAEDEALGDRLLAIQDVELPPAPELQARMIQAGYNGLEAALELAPELSQDQQRQLGRFLRQWFDLPTMISFLLKLKLDGFHRRSYQVPNFAMAAGADELVGTELHDRPVIGQAIGLSFLSERNVVSVSQDWDSGQLWMHVVVQTDPAEVIEVIVDGLVLDNIVQRARRNVGKEVSIPVEIGKEYFIDVRPPELAES